MLAAPIIFCADIGLAVAGSDFVEHVERANALARSAAAECAFLLTEQKWAEFQALKFDPKGKGPRLEQSMKEGIELIGKRLDEAKAAGLYD